MFLFTMFLWDSIKQYHIELNIVLQAMNIILLAMNRPIVFAHCFSLG